MSETARKRDETKKQIRALLLSAPAPLTVGEMKRDYHDFMGESIAFRAMGYDSLEDMFTDMRDAVQISWKNGLMVLQAVSDETTRHIESLVSKQKIPNPKKYAALRRGGRPTGSYGGQRQAPPSYRSRASPVYEAPRAVVPNFVRQQFKQLFKSYPNGLPLTHFETAFSRRFGVHLNFEKYGFHSLKSMLSSIMDIVQLQVYMGGEIRVMDASAKFQAEKTVKKESSPYSTVAKSQEDDVCQTAPRGRGRKISASSGGENRSVGVLSERSLSTESGAPPEIDIDVGINEQVQIRLQQLMAARPKGIWASRLPFEYRKMFEQDLNVTEHGFLSVIEFVSTLPSIIRIERPNPKGDWLLFDVRVAPECKSPVEKNQSVTEGKPHGVSGQAGEMKPHGVSDQSSEMPKSFVMEAIKQILLRNPKGIIISELPHLFRTETGHELKVEKFGFSRLESFLLSLPENIIQFSYVGAGRILLMPLQNNAEESREYEVSNENLDPKGEESKTVCNIPRDAVGPSNYYAPIDLPGGSDYIEVYVSNIVTPGLFWLQMKGKRTNMALEKLMEDLEKMYYSSEGENYEMPDNMLTAGQLCAVLFPEDENWHRGVITAIKDNNFIEVYYVDYGNTCSVQRKSLRLLRTKFLSLPAQAVQARLSNIQPAYQNWTITARNRMLQMCTSRPLIALVTNEKDRVLSVCLTDTAGETDVHINDILVQEGYAHFLPDSAHTNLSGPKQHAELPDYSYVFGWKPEPSLPVTTAYVQAVPQTTTTSSTNKHYVQLMTLTDQYQIHLINLERIAYVTSEEISAFFWDADILTSLLRQRNVEATKNIVSRKDYPHLFEELQKMGVKSVAESDPPRAYVTLYELLSLPKILSVFEHPSEELRKRVEECIEQFNPDDPHWNVKEGSVTESASFEDAALDTNELSLTLQLLQFKRKRILQAMMMDPHNTADNVNKLNSVEAQIMSIKSLLELSLSQEPSSEPKGHADLSTLTSTYKPQPDWENSRPQDRKETTATVRPTVKSPSGGTGSSYAVKTNVVNPTPQTLPTGLPESDVNPMTGDSPQSMAQLQQMYQSMLLSQQGSMQAFGPQMMPMMNPMAAMMFPYMQMPGMAGVPNQMPPLRGVGMGRGQLMESSMLLPGLMPLLQNLNQIRGQVPGGQGSGQSSGFQQFSDPGQDPL